MYVFIYIYIYVYVYVYTYLCFTRWRGSLTKTATPTPFAPASRYSRDTYPESYVTKYSRIRGNTTVWPARCVGVCVEVLYRGTTRTRNIAPLRPSGRYMPRAQWWC